MTLSLLPMQLKLQTFQCLTEALGLSALTGSSNSLLASAIRGRQTLSD